MKSVIETQQKITFENVVFVYADYGMWDATLDGSTLRGNNNKRIIQSCKQGYFITGDGYDYCRLYKSDLTPVSTADSPVTLQCLILDRRVL